MEVSVLTMASTMSLSFSHFSPTKVMINNPPIIMNVSTVVKVAKCCSFQLNCRRVKRNKQWLIPLPAIPFKTKIKKQTRSHLRKSADKLIQDFTHKISLLVAYVRFGGSRLINTTRRVSFIADRSKTSLKNPLESLPELGEPLRMKIPRRNEVA